MFDVIIKKGRIIDGTGREGYIADIGIIGKRIVKIDREILDEAIEIINAEELIVTPGFIDVHSHNDLVPLMKENNSSIKLMQGVTTELVGQCGLGVVPCIGINEGIWKNYIRGVVGNLEGEWSFKDFEEYLQQLSQIGLINNYSGLVSHGAIRTSVVGFSEKEPNSEELSMMCKVLEEAMEAGAYGMSLGLQYMPGIFSKERELVELCSIVEKYNGIIMVHLRNHDSTILGALEEIVDVSRKTRVRLHISHLRSYNSEGFGCDGDKIINYIDRVAAEGVKITFDEHLYLSGSTLMTQLFPPYASLEALKNNNILKRVQAELLDSSIRYPGWDNYSAVTTWDGVLITSVKQEENRKYIGKTVGEIAREKGVDPIIFAVELLIQEEGGVGIVTMDVFSESDTIKLIKHPLAMIGSDSIPSGNPHPRLYGNFPLYLGKYIRERASMKLEEAIQKATQFPARVIGYEDIGELRENKIADICIFDFEEIIGYEDYRDPKKPPKGIKYVLVNGKVALRDGEPAEITSGEVKRKK